MLAFLMPHARKERGAVFDLVVVTDYDTVVTVID